MTALAEHLSSTGGGNKMTVCRNGGLLALRQQKMHVERVGSFVRGVIEDFFVAPSDLNAAKGACVPQSGRHYLVGSLVG